MQVGKSGGLQSELNVTPMIDVVLVLLIIFMVVTPKNDQEMPVVVPQEATDQQEPPPQGDAPLVVEVDAEGALKFGDQVVAMDDLKARVAEALTGRKDKVVFLEAADDAPYDTCIHAMDAAKMGGAKHVGLLSPQVPPPAGAAPAVPAP
jgi:biopolymer transport protein ExbD